MKNVTFAIVALSCLLSAGATSHAQELPEMPKPQKEHKWLQRFVGEWESEVEASLGPDQPAMHCKGSQKARMLGAFWMIAEGSAEMMGTPMSSVLTLGYDPKQKKYIGTWTDSCNNHLWHYVGELSEDDETLTLNTEGPNMARPETTAKYRDVIEFKNKDHYTLSSTIQGENGEWETFMTADFRRKQ